MLREILEKKINEMSIACLGDWNEGVKSIGKIGEITINKKWSLIDNIYFKNLDKTFELRKLGSDNIYILGEWIIEEEDTKIGIQYKKRFKVIYKTLLKRQKKIEKQLNYKNLCTVKEVAIIEEYQNNDIGTYMYNYLIKKLNYNLMGCKYQFFGTRMFYKKLLEQKDLQIDLIDLDKMEILEKNVILHHGLDEKDFDKRLWSFDNKENVRAVITNIL